MDDTTKFLLGPVLALLPILVWELAIKPSRRRRNLALLLIAELELNLEEIAYYRVFREENAENLLVNLPLPRSSFTAVQAMIAELPASDLRDLVRFYALTEKIDATHVKLATTLASLNSSPTPDDKATLSAAISAGTQRLGRILDAAWLLGADARLSLDDVVRSSWMDAPPVIASTESIMTSARSRRAQGFSA